MVPLAANRVVPATIAYVANTGNTSTSGLTTYNFTSQTLGGQYAIIGIGGGYATGGRTVSSMSANSVAGTFIAGVEGAGGAWNSRAEIWIVPNPGASGTISVTWSGAIGRMAVIVWAANHLRSATPTQTGSDSGSPIAASLTIAPGGIAVGVYQDNNGTDYSWTGLTKNFFAFYSDGTSAASTASASGFSGTISTNSTAGARSAMQLAAFR